MKVRLDKLVFDHALAPSRERAQALILAGRVLVNEQKMTKPGQSVDEAAALRLLGDDMRYVSRGGLKLEGALRHWEIDLTGKFCLDIGTSTGGFTDCMLQHGASGVLAVDTGYGQIAERLRRDERVSLMERTNARNLSLGDLPAGIEFFSMDVSFISATLVLPAVIEAARHGAKPDAAPQNVILEGVILVKPQFEVGRGRVGKGGIVRDPEAHRFAVDRVTESVEATGGEGITVIDSPITGMEGNREFLLHARWTGTPKQLH